MCIQGIDWILSYILQPIKPPAFEELPTEAHDMKLNATTNSNQRLLIRDMVKE